MLHASSMRVVPIRHTREQPSSPARTEDLRAPEQMAGRHPADGPASSQSPGTPHRVRHSRSS